MKPELILMLGGIVSAILGLVGIAMQRAATPIRQLLSEDEQKSLDIQMLISEGKHLCPSCKIRYTVADLCGPCEQLHAIEMRAIQVASREPDQISLNESRRGTRSHVGYRPLYMQEGFADMFNGRETNDET